MNNKYKEDDQQVKENTVNQPISNEYYMDAFVSKNIAPHGRAYLAYT